MYSEYCQGENAVARLLTIYIEEAHPKDEWYLPDAVDIKNGNADNIFTHKSLSDRLSAASLFRDHKKLEMDILVDSMKGQVCDRYEAWPERLYIIQDGVVVYKGGVGPQGYKIPEVQQFLKSKFNR